MGTGKGSVPPTVKFLIVEEGNYYCTTREVPLLPTVDYGSLRFYLSFFSLNSSLSPPLSPLSPQVHLSPRFSPPLPLSPFFSVFFLSFTTVGPRAFAFAGLMRKEKILDFIITSTVPGSSSLQGRGTRHGRPPSWDLAGIHSKL